MSDYGAQDTSTTSLGANQFPISEAWTPNAGFSAVEGGTQTTDAGGKKSAPVRIEVKDGSDVSGGLTTDAAVTGDNPGTRSAKLRGLNKIWADVWDSVNHLFHFNQKQIGGTAIDTNSGNKSAGTQRVVLATDQPAVPVSGTFWQATQPVSGTFWQATQPVSGTFWQTTQPVSLSSLPALAAGSALIGSVELVDSAGTNKAAIDSAGNQAIKGNFLEVAGQAAGSVTGTSTPIILSTDVSAYKSWSFQMTGTWTMTLQVQFSDDNANWIQGIFFSTNSTGSQSQVTANGMYYGLTLGRYMRIIPTAWTSNASGVGTLELYTLPVSPHTMSVVQAGTWTVQPGNTANTTPWLVTANAPTSATATLANVGGSASSVALQASNANRKGWYCFNDSTSALYINFGATASATAFTVKVAAGGFFEMPTSPIYTGAINGIWDTATGSARVTELT